MKIFLVYIFLPFNILSLSWGKHYLVETVDDQDEDNDGIENIQLDEENIYQYLKEDQIEQFEKLSKKNQTKIISDLNTIIANDKGNGGKDYILDIFKNLDCINDGLANCAGRFFAKFMRGMLHVPGHG